MAYISKADWNWIAYRLRKMTQKKLDKVVQTATGRTQKRDSIPGFGPYSD